MQSQTVKVSLVQVPRIHETIRVDPRRGVNESVRYYRVLAVRYVLQDDRRLAPAAEIDVKPCPAKC
jgi:hypothetical protein